MNVTDEDLDGYTLNRRYSDETFIRIAIRRTTADAYPSGWRYALHYGVVDPTAADVETLEDGTILRYDNAHEATKGHERHLAPEPEAEPIDFPGMSSLFERFWEEIPKPAEQP